MSSATLTYSQEEIEDKAASQGSEATDEVEESDSFKCSEHGGALMNEVAKGGEFLVWWWAVQ